MQKPIELVPIPPPPIEQRARRGAGFAERGEKRNRYHLPQRLESSSPVGFRTRLALDTEEASQAAHLLTLEPPDRFVAGQPPTEAELFEEASLGVLTARQSTNYRGHRQVTLGPHDAARLVEPLRVLAPSSRVLDGAAYAHVALCRPYRTPFTFLLTFIGHNTGTSVFTVPKRAWDKAVHHADDIPSVAYLQHLHVGIWADAAERAALLASGGTRRANVVLPAVLAGTRGAVASRLTPEQAAALRTIEELAGLTDTDRRQGWTVAFVAQVGAVDAASPVRPDTCRRIGALLTALRSERIQPGVNAEEKAPPAYQARQDMDVPDALTEMCGRGALNAFARWTGLDRETCRSLLLLERVDVLTPNGKERLRGVRRELEEVTDRIVADMPLWADLPLGRALTRNAARGRKAFALAGQRIYIGGLARTEVEAAGVPFLHAVRAFGGAAARSALVAELSGCVGLPEDCDLLAGVCLMAGPVNQNDIGKQFQGRADLLAGAFPGRDPTSLLVWTLKAKTVADPIGNEEQLLNASQKGALVDLRPGPHEVASFRIDGRIVPMRARDGRTNGERAFGDVGNFVTDAAGTDIPGNRGSSWPEAWRSERPWV